MAKKSDKPLSKTDILNALADATGQSRKEVGALLEALEALIASNVSKGPGVFNLPGLLKIYVHTRPATKERTGRNPARHPLGGASGTHQAEHGAGGRGADHPGCGHGTDQLSHRR